jgi:hypothetical protein
MHIVLYLDSQHYTWMANMIILASYAQHKLLLHLPVDLKKIGPRYVPSKYEPR